MAVTPNGEYAYVTDLCSGAVSVISTTANTVTATVAVGNYPVGVAVTPDGAYAYVTNDLDGGNSVSVINTATNTVTATITVGNDPVGVAVTPDGAYAYVTNDEAAFGLGDKYGYEHSECNDNRWKRSLGEWP